MWMQRFVGHLTLTALPMVRTGLQVYIIYWARVGAVPVIIMTSSVEFVCVCVCVCLSFSLPPSLSSSPSPLSLSLPLPPPSLSLFPFSPALSPSLRHTPFYTLLWNCSRRYYHYITVWYHGVSVLPGPAQTDTVQSSVLFWGYKLSWSRDALAEIGWVFFFCMDHFVVIWNS